MVFAASLPPAEEIERNVSAALAEDIGPGDLTAGLIPEDRIGRATVISREDAVLCGTAWFDTVFRRIGHIYHSHLAGTSSLEGTVDHHLTILNAVANRHVEKAVAASDGLIGHVDAMFDRLENEIDPTLLDSAVAPLNVN